jgi:hypothetical protein
MKHYYFKKLNKLITKLKEIKNNYYYFHVGGNLDLVL